MRHLFFLALMLCALPAQASTLAIVTGAKTGTAMQAGKDIAAAVKPAGIHLTVKESSGSVEDVRRLNSLEKAQLAIVQSDVLGFLSRSHNVQTHAMAQHLRMILPLYNEEVHVLARTHIHSLQDLEGKRVVVGQDGSGDLITAINIMALMQIVPQQTLRLAPAEGVLALLDNKADAMFIVGGKPVKLLKNLESLKDEKNPIYARLLNDVHLLPVDDPRLRAEYHPADITHDDYAFVDGTVPTVAATAVLVTFDFSTPGNQHAQRCRDVRALMQALMARMDWLKAHGHAKWKEVPTNSSVPPWKKDACAWSKAEHGAHHGKSVHRGHHHRNYAVDAAAKDR